MSRVKSSLSFVERLLVQSVRKGIRVVVRKDILLAHLLPVADNLDELVASREQEHHHTLIA